LASAVEDWLTKQFDHTAPPAVFCWWIVDNLGIAYLQAFVRLEVAQAVHMVNHRLGETPIASCH
jgi:hypothetical protein